MPWPPRQPARSEIAPEDMEAYEFTIERAGRHAGAPDPETDAAYYGHLLLSAQTSLRLGQLGVYFRALGERGDSFSHGDREFVDQVFAADWKTNCVAEWHINDALSTGVRLEAIEALRYGREHELTEREALLASFIRKVVTGKMDADTWNRVEADMGERGVMDYACFILFLQTTMRGIQLTSGGQEPSDEFIDQMIADFKSGKRQIDDHRKRIG